ncbi:MAG: response regulator [Polyangiaceae bacterium]
MSGDPYKYFRVECRQLLDVLSTGIIALESGSAEADSATNLFRAAHTLKGAARIVRHVAIAEASHQLEEFLSPIRTTGHVPGAAELQQMLDLVQRMEEELDRIDAPAAEPPVTAPAPRVAPEQAPSSGEQHQALLASLQDAHAALRRIGALVGRWDTSANRSTSAEISTRLLEGLRYWSDVAQREITDSHEAALRLYHAPVVSLLPALELTVRDVAQVRRKRARVRIEGGELRIGIDYLARLKPALVQLARNAVAHGIEASPERERVGKEPVGNVVVGFKRRGRRLIVHCEDDGQGVDVDAVRSAAARRGLPTGSTDDELLSLLVQQPISTAARVDQAAGRGVGLDVVGSICRELGGSARVQTSRGKHTRVELDLPGLIGELEALLVRSREEAYLIPLEQVRQGQLSHASLEIGANGERAIDIDGQRMPLLELGGAPGPESRRTRCLVVVETSQGPLALQVDHIIGIRTVTPAPTPALHLLDASVSGVTILEDGDPVPILDAEALALRRPRSAPRSDRVEQLRVLVVDDSLTSRSLEQSILETAGYLVDTAASAEEGLRRLEQRRYSLCLVDVEMPGMDGFSFVRALRGNRATARVPAILISSRNSPSDREAGRQAGAQDYMAKQEFDQSRLLERIGELTR